jgi:hypothetical protein
MPDIGFLRCGALAATLLSLAAAAPNAAAAGANAASG